MKDKTDAIMKGILFGVPCLLALAVWLKFGDDIRAWRRQSQLARAFSEQQLNGLYDKAMALIPGRLDPEKPTEPSARGRKCVWIKKQAWTQGSTTTAYAILDQDFGRLPPAACAENAATVGSVVVLSAASPKVGVYVDEQGKTVGGAFDELLDVYLVDLAKSRFLGWRRFVWKAKPEARPGEMYLYRDSDEVVRWYMSLPED